ncbi:hypothetical protein ACU61A_41530 [Pseudonocardia sichuanensis]
MSGTGASRPGGTSDATAPATGAAPVPPTWAPVDACRLPTPEQPLREAEFDALFARSLRGVERRAPTWLRLHLEAGAGVEARARDLTARESSCCTFFGFRVAAVADGLTLDVRVPEARIAVLDGLARRAAATRVAADPRATT